ncbi:MAG: GNAT family N-acetyltransferase [Bacteroidota bacterium]
MIDARPPRRLLDLRRIHYASFADYDADETVLRHAWTFFTEQPQAAWYDGQTFVAGLYALPAAAGTTWAFGYFETEPHADPHAFAAEWAALRATYPGAWVGPMLGSTFLPYRVVTEDSGTPYFPGEWRTLPEYAELLNAQNPAKTIAYRSAERTDVHGVIAVSQPFLDRWTEQGFALQPLDPGNSEHVVALRGMIDDVFGANFGYQALTEPQFDRWRASLASTHGGTPLLHWVQIAERRVGFSYLFALDDGTVIFKTIGLLPEFQAQGLGNAVAGALHQLAQRRQAPRCIYALVQADNRVNRMPDPDIRIIRSYAAYFFNPLLS